MPLLVGKNHLGTNFNNFSEFMERGGGFGFELKRTMEAQI